MTVLDMPGPLDIVCRHLATVAVDGAGAEMEHALAPGFVLHLDGVPLDRSGYLALVAARWAAEGHRPPLEVVANTAVTDPTGTADAGLVTVALAPRGLGHFRVAAGVIAAAWITTDWNAWLDPLQVGQTF